MSDLELEFARRQQDQFKYEVGVLMDLFRKHSEEYESELTRLREERDRYRKFAEYVSMYSNDPTIVIEARKLLSGSEGER